ncbi:MAG: DUF2442 domain-containing protein [Hymenobacteraceae bacterium]|nr:DUF2442 domain-containing protein [Hymenobacteraceae bacterium]
MKFIVIPPAAKASSQYVRVESAQLVAPYTLAITFNTGETRTVDFGPFLRASHHPAVRAYLDEARFQEFEVVGGNLNWHDYDLIFPVADLYAGSIS